jgi:hypothetical protein
LKNNDIINLVIRSLEAIPKQYTEPFKDLLYERSICYEFYHQFRSRMPDSGSFVLNGELEKGYREIEEVPDFVFHVPQTDKHNLAVMEFKSTNNSMKEINNDLVKLVNFKNEPLSYQLGIFVLFGPKAKLMEKFYHIEKPWKRYDANLIKIAYDIELRKVIGVSSL